MKLFYKLSSVFISGLLLSTSFSVHGQEAADVNVQYLEVGAGGLLYSDSDVEIIYSNDGTVFSRSYFAPCTGMSGTFNAIQLTNKGGYIDVIRKSDKKIEKVEFVGASGNAGYESAVLCGISLDGTEFVNGDFYTDEEWNEAVTQPLTYSGEVGSICENNDTFTVPDAIYEIFNEDGNVTNVRSKLNKIRLIRSDTFGDITFQNNYPTEFCNIKIWYVGSSTGVSESDLSAKLSVSRHGDSFVLNQPADVEVYNLGGQRILQEREVDNFTISGYPKGVYIVKMSNGQSTVVTKVIY